jgi:hypothetical protein
MDTLKFATIPSNIQLYIISHLSIQSLVRLYQLSRYWKRRIGSDKSIWRSVYENYFGREFANDGWILWAVRRLWSQSSSKEKRLAARHVNLATLESLDAYTWYRLVRGRVLTERNWRNNTPQRSIAFPEGQLNILVSGINTQCNLTYGLVFAYKGVNRLTFAIIDDTLNDASSSTVSGAKTYNIPSWGAISSGTQKIRKYNVVFGRVVQSDQIIGEAPFSIRSSSEEFIIANSTIVYDDQSSSRRMQTIFAWDIGQLEMHDIDGQLCCVPRLCTFDLLPDDNYWLLTQRSGWMLIQYLEPYIDKYDQQKYWQYILYDIRRGRLASAFAVRGGTWPTIGRATLDKVQIYYGLTVPVSNAATKFETSGTESYQYCWCTVEISAQPDIPIPAVDPSWHKQMLMPQTIEKTKRRYYNVMECVREHKYWCDKYYLLKKTMAKETIHLPVDTNLYSWKRHLFDDLFLILHENRQEHRCNVFLVHSTRQKRVLWSRTTLTCSVIIPDEKAILVYEPHSIAQLLDIYTGNVLNSFEIKEYSTIVHVIGPLCSASDDIRNVLIDVRTGERIRTLVPGHMTQSLDPFVQASMERALIPHFIGPVHIEHANWPNTVIWIDEYAQI